MALQLKAARGRLGVSQRAFAQRTGIQLDRARRILQAINLEPDSQPLGPAFIASIDTLEPALRASRNRIMHGAAANPAVSTPAYRLDDDDTEIS